MRVPDDLLPGEYVIEATDVQGLEASVGFRVDPKFIPTPPPVPEPVLPTPPDSEPTPPPKEPVDAKPDCPTGFTYSPTFRQCIEDASPDDSPYAGQPCNPQVPMYQQKGCIPQE